MLDEPVPACGLLVEAVVAGEELDPSVPTDALMRAAVGNSASWGQVTNAGRAAMVVGLLAGC